jgi:hypothetical protein
LQVSALYEKRFDKTNRKIPTPMKSNVKKALSFIYPLTIMGCLLLFASGCGDDNGSNSNSTDKPAGSGTSLDPYLIASLNNLKWLTENSAEWGKSYKQTANINASTATTWNHGSGFFPIGNPATPFKGTYDGGGYTIDQLKVSAVSSNLGLFGYTIRATIKNLKMTNVNVSGTTRIGGLVGYSDTSSTVSNCSSTGSVIGSTAAVGGVVGLNSYHSTVSNCYSTSSVTGGSISYDIGGLVGLNLDNSTVSNSYSTGSVAGGSGSYQIGGLVGDNFTSTVSTCYSTGSVSGTSSVGGLVGRNISIVTNSFWDKQTSGQTTSPGGTGMTTAEMKQQATFTGWDFTTIWKITEGVSYPKLQWQP